jgi:hypothetical protein
VKQSPYEISSLYLHRRLALRWMARSPARHIEQGFITFQFFDQFVFGPWTPPENDSQGAFAYGKDDLFGPSPA